MAYSPLLPCLMALIFFSQSVLAHKASECLSPNTTNSWTNTDSSTLITYRFPHGVEVRVILLNQANRGTYSDLLSFALGFYCDPRHNSSCSLALMFLESDQGVIRTNQSPHVVWLANRDKPIKENATLQVVQGRGLVLIDSNGTEVWSTKIPTHESVGAMILKNNGNLVLKNTDDAIIWQSFNQPTDTLLLGQGLHGKQRLISSLKKTNWRHGWFYLSLESDSLTAFLHTKTPVAYLHLKPRGQRPNDSVLHHATYNKGNLVFCFQNQRGFVHLRRRIRIVSPIQILRLDPDGGLRIYFWESGSGWQPLQLPLVGRDKCLAPLGCGPYGLCTGGFCSCPIAADGGEHLHPVLPRLLNHGCHFERPLLPSPPLNPSFTYQLVDFGNLSYFGYLDPTAVTAGITSLEACKHACEIHSSCKAAFFRYKSNISDGRCYLTPKVLSMRAEPIPGHPYNSSTSIKVPFFSGYEHPPPAPGNYRNNIEENHQSSATAMKMSAVVVIIIILCAMVYWKIRHAECLTKSTVLEQAPGTPVTFSCKTLYAATNRFSKRLGRGGSGAVFKGVLRDGTEIAVKRLDNIDQGMDEFVAEVKTMSSIHHINLVKLIGFCASKTNRLLVYEYMRNGSLDKWIFDQARKKAVNWETRRGIMLDVARGLAYIHEECRQRIAHLDVKPQNILLDENFNAKISDFGLARFIDRNQSHVVTAAKGTIGYLAPEWQYSKVTVKADIYSFGVVVLEVISGRMNLDYSRDEAHVHLLGILQRKVREDRLIDIADRHCDIEAHEEDVLKMIRIGIWCLNGDQSRRPSMSTVVKVMEGALQLDPCIDLNFTHLMFPSCSSSTRPS